MPSWSMSATSNIWASAFSAAASSSRGSKWSRCMIDEKLFPIYIEQLPSASKMSNARRNAISAVEDV